MMRINVGCGQTPTEGWRNFDNSLSLRLAKIPLLPIALRRAGLIAETQWQFIQFARGNRIEYGDILKGLPLPRGSVEVMYASHMLEHLDRDEADSFMLEARRLIRPQGILRVAVPDIKKHIAHYHETGDADAFIESTHLSKARPKSMMQRLRFLLVGPRHHQWMYDGKSLVKLMTKHGFGDARVQPAGETMIVNFQPLDLYERLSESVYVEGRAPVA